MGNLIVEADPVFEVGTSAHRVLGRAAALSNSS